MSALDTIRRELRSRNIGPRKLERMAGISYRAAWHLCKGDSERISWHNLDCALYALGLTLS